MKNFGNKYNFSLNRIRSQVASYEIRGKTLIDTWIGGKAYEQYDLYVKDSSGIYVKATSGILQGCFTQWTVSGVGGSATFISTGRTSAGGGTYNPTGQIGPSVSGTPAITTVYLFAAENNGYVTISVSIYNCDDFSYDSGGQVSKQVQLKKGLVISTNVPPEPPPLPQCEFQISGPSNLNCGQIGVYGPLNPNLSSGEYYTYEISNSSWKLIPGKNSSSIGVIAPIRRSFREYSRIETSILCITKYHPGFCEPYSVCMPIQASCNAISRGNKYSPSIIKPGNNNVNNNGLLFPL